MRLSTYYVLEEESPELLSMRVNDYLARGFSLVGGLSVANNTYTHPESGNVVTTFSFLQAVAL